MQFEQKIKEEIPQDDSTDIEEKLLLYREIKRLKPNVVVETGTHRGLTTMYMAQAILENGGGELHTADPFEWGQLGNFRKFPDHEKVITYYQIPGKDLKVDYIDFLFIDGFHEKHEVLAEIDSLFPRLSNEATVYFHDTNGSNSYCDVVGAIKERGLEVEFLKTKNGMAKYEHKRNNTKSKARRTKSSPRVTKKSVNK